MRRHVRISAEAEAEMANASRWYDRQRHGLGIDFVRSIDRIIAHIADRQRAGSPVPGVADADIRRIRVPRFPYHVVYVELRDHARVLAVAHHRRHPEYWFNRIPS